MSASGKRHETLRAIVRGSSQYLLAPEFERVDAELLELTRCARIQPERRKRLLQAIHATRALDTSLGVLLNLHGVAPEQSLGPRMTQMANLPANLRGHLPQSVVLSFRASICNKRNKCVHNADHYPTSAHEVDALVSDIETCLSAFM